MHPVEAARLLLPVEVVRLAYLLLHQLVVAVALVHVYRDHRLHLVGVRVRVRV